MSIPVLTLFNNKGGVGKTTLAYHLAWMISELGHKVLVCDFDPQANLTAAFLDTDELEQLWMPERATEAPNTIFRCIEPLVKVGDLREPQVRPITDRLWLVPGDLALAGFEDKLSIEWPQSAGATDLYRPFRVLSSLWQVAQLGARSVAANLVIADAGPNFGAINRSVMIGSDWLLVPLATDLFSLQGVANLGPTLQRWRIEWRNRVSGWQQPQFPLPGGAMQPIGYVIQQPIIRQGRPVRAYEKWADRIPAEYRRSVLGESRTADQPPPPDPNCLAVVRHLRSLIALSQEARKPAFSLTIADGAIGSHAQAVREVREELRTLAEKVLDRVGIPPPAGAASTA